jgi:hypothetical protein
VTTWNPSLWTHSPDSGMTLLLRLGTTMSTVGWNILGLQPVGVLFSKKISSLCYGYLPVYDLFLLCIYLTLNLIFRICMLVGYDCA